MTTTALRDYGVIAAQPFPTNHQPHGQRRNEMMKKIDTSQPVLYDYITGDEIRNATENELRSSVAAASDDGGRGVIDIDGRSCYVDA